MPNKICCIENCGSRKGPWNCTICGRDFCDDHILVLETDSMYSLYNDKIYDALLSNPTIQFMVKQNVKYVCKDCISLAELKEIDDVEDGDIPLLINRDFITDTSEDYFFRRISGGGRDPHIFDFGVRMLKELVDKIKKEIKE